MPARSEGDPDLVDCTLNRFGRDRGNLDVHPAPRAVDLLKSGERNYREVVLRLAEDISDGLCNADYSEWTSVYFDFGANGINGGEELIGNIRAHETGIRAVVFVFFSNVPALSHLHCIYIDKIVGDAPQSDVVEHLRSATNIHGLAGIGRGVFDVHGMFLDGMKIIELDVLVFLVSI